jgi:membrane protein YqaA with SNARE-associated domain
MSWSQSLSKRFMHYAGSPKAPWALAMISFTESSFLPIPPDFLMVPMMLKDRQKIFWYAFIATITSVIGGLLGYAIGYFLFQSLGHWVIETYHLHGAFERFQTEFQRWGFYLILAKGLTPIPYKVVTIASGMAHLNIAQFVGASIVARATRFYAIGIIIWFFGDRARDFFEKHAVTGIVISTLIVIAGFVIIKFLV